MTRPLSHPVAENARSVTTHRSRVLTARKTSLDSATVAKIDRITELLLAQLEAQAQAALVLLDRASPDQREAFLAGLAELRGRLVRLRARVVGPTAPVLVRRASRG